MGTHRKLLHYHDMVSSNLAAIPLVEALPLLLPRGSHDGAAMPAASAALRGRLLRPAASRTNHSPTAVTAAAALLFSVHEGARDAVSVERATSLYDRTKLSYCIFSARGPADQPGGLLPARVAGHLLY